MSGDAWCPGCDALTSPREHDGACPWCETPGKYLDPGRLSHSMRRATEVTTLLHLTTCKEPA